MIVDNGLYKILEKYFESIDKDRKHIYFKFYYSYKQLKDINVVDFVSTILNLKSGYINIISSKNDLDLGNVNYIIDYMALRIKGNNVLVICEIPNSRLLFIYSSTFPERDRRTLATLSRKYDWLLDSWISPKIIEDLIEKYAPSDRQVLIRKSWSPYWLHKKYSYIPYYMQDFVERNIESFERQEVEISVSAPRRLVNNILKREIKEEFLRKSNTVKGNFPVVFSNPGVATISVSHDGLVVHRTGCRQATLKIIELIEGRFSELYKRLEDVIPLRIYRQYKSGIADLVEYKPPKTLLIYFPYQEFNEETSVRLSNLLTVGQKGEKIQGIITQWDGLKFVALTYLTFDNSKLIINFDEYNNKPALSITPIHTTLPGLVYLLNLIEEKFDPKFEYKILGDDISVISN